MKKRAIVMGASSGLGRETALRLLRDGWQVGLAARRTELLDTILVESCDKPFTACIDVTQHDADVRLRQLIERMGGVDLYFHVSGIGKQNTSLDAGIELATVDTNGLGFARMVGEAFRWMAAHGGGHIAVVSSIAGTKGLGPAPAYSATKAFQNTYVQSLEQLSNSEKLNIRFTDIRPGFVDTALIEGSRFPMTLQPGEVVDEMMWAVSRYKHVVVIDWKWRWVVALWRLIPNALWRRLPLTRAQRQKRAEK